MKHFKTKAGTELPLLDLRGKDYLQVAHRLVWFREEHPDWTIQTDYLELAENHAICKATVSDNGKVIATGHKYEDRKGFQDFIEKAETGSIGRALAACGYGTQFAPELDEGERIVDSPQGPKKAPGNALPAQNTGTLKSVSAPKKPSITGGPTQPQINRLWAIARDCGWDEDAVYDYLSSIGIEDVTKMNTGQYDYFCNAMKKYPKEPKALTQ